jgi:hypothetical protein
MGRIAPKIAVFDQATNERVYALAVAEFHHNPDPKKYPCLLPTDPAARDDFYARIYAILDDHDNIRTLLECVRLSHIIVHYLTQYP